MTKDQNQTEQPVSGAMTEKVWVVLDESGHPIHCASYPAACHDHINDAINEHDIVEAARWKVRCFVPDSISQDAIRNAALEEVVKLCWHIDGRKNWRQEMQDAIRAMQSAPAQNGERPDGISPAAYDRLHSLCESQAARIMELEQSIVDAIEYPDEWDTAAYPTLESALHELAAWHRVSRALEAQSDAQQSDTAKGAGGQA